MHPTWVVILFLLQVCSFWAKNSKLVHFFQAAHCLFLNIGKFYGFQTVKLIQITLNQHNIDPI